MRERERVDDIMCSFSSFNVSIIVISQCIGITFLWKGKISSIVC